MSFIKNTIALICCLISFSSISQTHIWIGNAGNTNWHDIMNWDVNSLPTASSDVTIPENFNVSISQASASVNSISINANSIITVEDNLTISQDIFIKTGAHLTFKKGVMSGGIIENDGTLQFETFDSKDLSNITINNRSDILITNSNVIRFFNTTTINNSVTGAIIIDSNGGIIEQTASIATINNSGLIKKVPSDTGGAFYMIYDMNNAGIIDIGENQTFLFLTPGQGFYNLENGIMQGNGAFDITSNFINNGIVSPAGDDTIGSLEIVNNFSLSATAKLVIDINGTNPEDYDFISVFGSPDLNGSIDLKLNFEAAVGDEFTILNAILGISTCDFPQQITTTYNSFEYTFNVICNSNTIVLQVASVTLSLENYQDPFIDFYVVPNPVVKGSLFKFPDNLINTNTSISIYNYLGQEVQHINPTNRTVLNSINFASGLYFAQLKRNQTVLATTKFIVP